MTLAAVLVADSTNVDRLAAFLDSPAAVIVALTVIVGAAWRYVIRPLRKVVTETGQFLEDWNGRAADPLRQDPGHPGVMARLDSIEHELKTNGGSSVKDAVNRIEARQLEHFAEARVRDDRIDELAGVVRRWQSVDRTQAEVATTALNEVLHTDIQLPPTVPPLPRREPEVDDEGFGP